MKSNYQLSSALPLLLILLLPLALVACGYVQASEEGQDNHGAIQSDKPKLFKILDFNRFKTIFHKKYNSMLEEVSRMRIYLAKCLKSYVSIINYKLRKSTSYRSINYMSDWTKEERQRTSMKMDAFKSAHAVNKTYNDDKLLEQIGDDEVKNSADKEAPGIIDELDVERTMVDMAIKLQANTTDQSLREIAGGNAGSLRRKRDLGGKDVADLLGGVLAQNDDDDDDDDEIESNREASKSDFHVPSAVKPKTRAHEEEIHEQVLYVDHRDCMNEIKFQSQCGSCYVFAAISALEWHHCKATGRKVDFSEQYALDCGESTCQGGYASDVIDFSLKYGVDTSDNFPYFARARKCTFGKPINYEDMAGYLRITGLSYRHVPLRKLKEEIVNGPVLFAVAHNQEFLDYGGGVDDMKDCDPNELLHAMIMVGHGRENGVDFWLARNSFSDTWGENGYYKLSNEGLKRCYFKDKIHSLIVEADNPRFRRNRNYNLERMTKLKQNWLATQARRDEKGI